jgi:hypothetical protein
MTHRKPVSICAIASDAVGDFADKDTLDSRNFQLETLKEKEGVACLWQAAY